MKNKKNFRIPLYKDFWIKFKKIWIIMKIKTNFSKLFIKNCGLFLKDHRKNKFSNLMLSLFVREYFKV